MKLIKYLPDFMANIKEMKIIEEAQQQEYDDLKNNLKGIQKELFVETADNIGIERFEKMLNINSSEYEDMEYRRLRIKLKLLGYDKISLENRLRDIVGEDNFTINVDVKNKYVQVKLTVKSEKYLNEVSKVLDRIIPCNLKLNVSILYSSHNMTKAYTHKYLSGYKNSDIKLIGI